MRLLLLAVICYSLLPLFHTYVHRFADRYVSFDEPCTIQADDLQYANESCTKNPWTIWNTFGEITELQIIGKNSTVPRRFVEKIPNVESLRIRNNSLTSIDGMSICQWKQLQWIDADFNSLGKLTNGFLFHCKQLNKLLLRNNKIKEIESDAFIGLKSLRYLDLSSNKLTYLDKNVFKQLKKLENLNLNTNRIQKIDFELFRYNMLIGVLSLSNNDLKTIPSELFLLLEYIEVFFANNNPMLGSIDMRHADSLKELSIANASLTKLFIPSNVQEVYLDNNQISQIFVEPNNTLVDLSLGGNRITSPLLEGNFNHLKRLSLHENPIPLQSINDLSVIRIKTKYPSITFLSIPTIDDRKAEKMILEAEENQIVFAIDRNRNDLRFDILYDLKYLQFENQN
ncbi:relaxin receptor 1-like [Contarinia nasturtii]|uniref:relaxin receptor 1-like n=1 Tax=Contarinia nasturtii TaxID=265458 RepID=UPI0012D4369F|nr:relaxin receptor 1-like [Contarinia nasturtii]